MSAAGAVARPSRSASVPVPRGPSGRIPGAARRAALALAIAVLPVGRAGGQTDSLPGSAPDSVLVPAAAYGPSPLLEEGHWAVRAAARAEAMGLVRGYLPAQRAVPRAAVAYALGDARARAQGRPGVERVAEGWWARFVEEFPEYAGPARPGRPFGVLGGAAWAGYASSAGRLSPAVGIGPSRQQPAPVPDQAGPRAGALLAAAAGPVGASAVLRAAEHAQAVPRWDLSAAVGPVGVSLGREVVGYGPGRTGGVIFSGTVPVARLEAQTLRPLRLPGPLRPLGHVAFHAFLGPVRGDPRHPDDPWLLGARVAVRPHARLDLAVSRGTLFGGDEPATAARLARMLVGVLRSDFENQVLSFDARWRPPVEAVLPMSVYVEWGADDAAGGLNEMPGRVAGVFVAALPGAPEAGVGAEYTRFPDACCGHGSWYFNQSLPGNWALGARPLGHPLGGEGDEYALYGEADLRDARLRVEGRAFARSRSGRSEGQGNLFSAARVGRSRGGGVQARWRALGRTELRAGFFADHGDGWRERAAHVDVAVLF